MIGLLGSLSEFSVGDWIGFIILEPLAILGLYLFAYKKKAFSASFWQITFWVFVVSDIISALDATLLNQAISRAVPFLNSNVIESNMEILFSIILTIPAFYAIYKLGYKKN